MYYDDVLMKVIDKYKVLNKDKRVVANMLDAQILESVMRKPFAPPKVHADFLKLAEGKVIQCMRYFAVNSRDRRSAIFQEIDVFLKLTIMQLNHERADTIKQELKQYTKELPMRLKQKCDTDRMMRGFYLLALLKFCGDKRYYDIFPKRQIWVKSLSAVDARNFFRDLAYEIDRKEKGFDVNSLTDLIKESVHEDGEVSVDEDEAQEDKIQALEFKLQTTQSTLKFIQRSLDDMVANVETKTKEAQNEAINDFFAMINSERYGRLLDNSLLIDKKLAELRKQRYKFPIEIMAMPMIIKNFIAFIKSIGFEPIRIMGEQFEATAEDLAYDVYDGEPFISDEKKMVQVICPGWKRNGVILSKPVVKEIYMEEK